MSIAFVNSAFLFDTGGSPSTSVSTNAFAATTGNLIVVLIRQQILVANGLPESVTDTAGNKYRCISAASQLISSQSYQSVWYAYNIAGNASNVVTVKFGPNSSGTAFIGILVRQYSGLSTTVDPFDVAAVGTATGTSLTSASFSTSKANSVIVAFGNSNSGGQTYTVGLIGGVTATNQASDAGGGGQVTSGEDLIVSSTQTGITAAMSNTVSDVWGISVVVFSDVGTSATRFDYVQSKENSSLPAVTTMTVVLDKAPTPGNLVCVGVVGNTGGTFQNVQDSNSNVFNITSKSPSSAQNSGAGSVWSGWLVAPANASATITATFTTGISLELFVCEFVMQGGTVSFDNDAIGSGTSSSTINTPAITPAAAGELLVCCATPTGAITSCGTPWTMTGPGIPSFGTAQAFITNSTNTSTALNFPCSSSSYDSMVMAFAIVASNVDTIVETLQFQLR